MLERMIKLQEIDIRLIEIRELMGDLPVTVEDQEVKISDLGTENTEKQTRVEEIEKEIRHRNSEIEDFTSKLTKYKDQLYLVTSNKEYDALSAEIDHMKATIKESEDILLTIEEEKIDLNEAVKLNSSKIEEVSESLKINRNDLEDAISETIHEQQALESNRKVIFKEIETGYTDTYERVRHAREGIGMASIINRACGSCFSQLPPQTVVEIKSNDKILSCPSCAVFLYWDGAEE